MYNIYYIHTYDIICILFQGLVFLNMGDLLLKGHIDREHDGLSADGMG